MRTNTAEQSSASKQACTKHGVTLAELNAYMLQRCAPTALHSETSSPSNCVLRLLPELDSSRVAPTCVSARPTCVEGVCEWCVCERVGASAERPPAITLAGASLAIGLISIMIVARPDPPKTQPSGSTPGTRWRCTPPRSRHEGLK